eukprot:Opistho-2@85910
MTSHKAVQRLVLCCIFAFSIAAVAEDAPAPSRSFVINGPQFVKDGSPFRIIGGSIHYFRSMPQRWPTLLAKLKACGMNTVQFVIPWNVHEIQRGVFDFKGRADVVHFIKLAQHMDLNVVIRPGPYICAEHDFGGFPWWLLSDPSIKSIRDSDPNFLAAVGAWWDVLLPMLKPLLYSNGGPILMAQVENEYGSYGSDKTYLTYLRDSLRKHFGDDVILHSTDGPSDSMLSGSEIDGVYQTVDFGPGSDPPSMFAEQRKYTAGPLMNSEYYPGWLTHWTEKAFPNIDGTYDATWLDKILAYNASVNLYMFHGGTNFGYYNGANTGSSAYEFQPTVTSYDYDAPLTESGNYAPKYNPICTVVAKYADGPVPPRPTEAQTAAYGSVALSDHVSLFDALGSALHYDDAPVTMEMAGIGQGFALYSTTVKAGTVGTLAIKDVRDRAIVFLDGVVIGTVYRNDGQIASLNVTIKDGASLDVLVENMGHVNYGSYIYDPKGLIGGVTLNNEPLNGWSVRPIRDNDVTHLPFVNGPPPSYPAFTRGHVVLPGGKPAADTYLAFDGFTKGVAFVNGVNIGRYWNVGPQFTLFVPADLLVPGVANEIVILELHGYVGDGPAVITLQDSPRLNRESSVKPLLISPQRRI